jgi:hypothetical protein
MTSAPNGWDQAGRSHRTLPHRPQSILSSRGFFTEFGAWRNATPEQREGWAHAAGVSRDIAEHNRELLRRHPDLAARLVQLLGLQRFDQWNGYVPPAIGHITENNRAIINHSPNRAGLLELLSEAGQRDKT